MVTKTVRHTRIAALNFLTLGHFPHPVFTQHWFCKSSRLLLSDKFVKVSTLYISFRFTIWVEKAEGKHSCLILLNLVFSKCRFQSHFLLMIWNPPHNYFSYVFFSSTLVRSSAIFPSVVCMPAFLFAVNVEFICKNRQRAIEEAYE